MDPTFTEVADYCRDVLSRLEQAKQSDSHNKDDNKNLPAVQHFDNTLNVILSSRLREFITISDHGKRSSNMLKHVLEQRRGRRDFKARLWGAWKVVGSQQPLPCPRLERERLARIGRHFAQIDLMERNSWKQAILLKSDVDSSSSRYSADIFVHREEDISRPVAVVWADIDEKARELEDLHEQIQDQLSSAYQLLETIPHHKDLISPPPWN